MRYMMLLWKRYVLVGTCFFIYTLVTFYLSSINKHECADSVLPRDLPPCVLPDTQSIQGLDKWPLEARFRKAAEDGARDKGILAPTPNRDVHDIRKANSRGADNEVSDVKEKTLAKKLDPLKKVVQNEVDTLPANSLLHPGLAPTTVVYVWCGRRWLEFHHYMSVLSVIRLLRPDNIFFYYDEEPVLDNWLYNTWYKELRESYALFIPIKLDPSQGGCENFGRANIDFIYNSLYQGAIYVHEQTIFNTFPLELRNYSFVYGLTDKNTYSFILSNRSTPIRELLKDPHMPSYRTHHLKCPSYKQFEQDSNAICVIKEDVFFPKDIWTADTKFAEMIRKHFYQSPLPREPTPNYDSLVPNIAHIVWLGGGAMDMLFYLCVISLLYAAEVDTVYIHGDLPPSGFYWEMLENHPRVKVIYRASPQRVFGTPVNVISHVTDVWRVDFMIKYGGIYVDTDTAFVRPLDRHIRAFDAVATYDWTYWNHPFPDTINFGVTIGKRNAEYWQLFQKSMQWFLDEDWSWNGLRQPYKVQERHPQLVRVDPLMQVCCFQYKCHPTWVPDYHNESVHHENTGSMADWQSRGVYAFHWTQPTPPELDDWSMLLSANTLHADVGRYILRKAGILQADNRTLIHPNGFKQIVDPPPQQAEVKNGTL